MGTALYGLARVAQSDDDPDHVRRLLAESLRLLHQIGSRGIFDVLRALGALAVRRGDPARGVRLLAAGPAGRIPIPGLWLWLRDRETLQAEWETSLEMASSVLGEEPFARAWAEGQEMTLERAIAYALEADET